VAAVGAAKIRATFAQAAHTQSMGVSRPSHFLKAAIEDGRVGALDVPTRRLHPRSIDHLPG
jgi:hypothetical protein